MNSNSEENKTEPSTPVLTPRNNSNKNIEINNKIQFRTVTKNTLENEKKAIINNGGIVDKIVETGNNRFTIHYKGKKNKSTFDSIMSAFSSAITLNRFKNKSQGGKRKTKKRNNKKQSLKRKKTVCFSKKGIKTKCIVRYY